MEDRLPREEARPTELSCAVSPTLAAGYGRHGNATGLDVLDCGGSQATNTELLHVMPLCRINITLQCGNVYGAAYVDMCVNCANPSLVLIDIPQNDSGINTSKASTFIGKLMAIILILLQIHQFSVRFPVVDV
jgi:hypothetical protein